MFIDETRVYLKAGDGGKGCQSFARTTNRAFRGADGGSGGTGGNVIFEVDPNLNSLGFYRNRRHHKAEAGMAGKKRADGKNSKSLVLRVPIGTCVFSDEGNLLADLNAIGQQVVIARGGRGGRGNRELVSRTNPVPRYAERGEPGEEIWVRMELKLSADVGIIGFPNAGKSTLISKLSNARPKIANYPFTTLEPSLGMVPISELETVLLADIPGIIEGAHEGHGLGHQFLRHVERTGFLLHLIDLFPYDQSDPFESYHKVNTELQSYSKSLSIKPQLVVLNKIDLPEAVEAEKNFRESFRQSGDSREVLTISALSGVGLEALVRKLAELVGKHPSKRGEEGENYLQERKSIPLSVTKEGEIYLIQGSEIERIHSMTDFQNEEASARFQKLLQKRGIVDQLFELGAQDGDTIRIGKEEFLFAADEYL